MQRKPSLWRKRGAVLLMRRRSLILPFVAALVVAVMTFLSVEQLLLRQSRTELDQSLVLTRRAVEAEIDRFRALPAVAGEDARIALALSDVGGAAAILAANRYLETIAAHAGAADLFLLDDTGTTIAASNWQKPGSFIGENYGFRPYFRQAMQSGSGQFYAIGITTGIPGHFLSSRVTGIDGASGVLVVKVDLRPLQETWRRAGLETALVDADGVVFLSGKPEWIYRPIAPLSAAVVTRISMGRTYAGASVETAKPILTEWPQLPDATGQGWFARIFDVPSLGWRLMAARPDGPVLTTAFGASVLAALAGLLLTGSAMAWDQRRQLIALRLSQNERLEAMVEERTKDLGHEIEARKQAEMDLRQAQESLIHAEKMAALGRMSTAIVHEVSQPIAALEATLVAAEMTLPEGSGKLGQRIDTARGLIRRMQRTIRHLKSFGRKESGELTLVNLSNVIASALELVSPRARDVGVSPAMSVSPQVQVRAGAVRMEQVVVNLVLNALDAVEGRSDAMIRVEAFADGQEAVIRVTDNGVGISETNLPKVTEPFFSTKLGGAGEESGGLGLGLSICRAILAEFGGSLHIDSAQGRGCQVMVRLPLWQDVAVNEAVA